MLYIDNRVSPIKNVDLQSSTRQMSNVLISGPKIGWLLQVPTCTKVALGRSKTHNLPTITHHWGAHITSRLWVTEESAVLILKRDWEHQDDRPANDGLRMSYEPAVRHGVMLSKAGLLMSCTSEMKRSACVAAGTRVFCQLTRTKRGYLKWV